MQSGRTKLNDEQRRYLINLRDALKEEILFVENMVGNDSGNSEVHLRNTVRFIQKIIEKGGYFKESAASIYMVTDEFHYLIEHHKIVENKS